MSSAFDLLSVKYDEWFEKHHGFYQSELEAIKALLPSQFNSAIEIGAGTGRFGSCCGISQGVEISKPMALLAQKRGMHITFAQAHNLPFQDFSFDLVLMVTSLCFFQNPQKAIQEAFRVLQKKGTLIIAFVNKESPLGKAYQEKKETQKNSFYHNATFYTPQEVILIMQKAGFSHFKSRQTLFNLQEEQFEKSKSGFNKGSFIVIKGIKKDIT